MPEDRQIMRLNFRNAHRLCRNIGRYLTIGQIQLLATVFKRLDMAARAKPF